VVTQTGDNTTGHQQTGVDSQQAEVIWAIQTGEQWSRQNSDYLSGSGPACKNKDTSSEGVVWQKLFYAFFQSEAILKMILLSYKEKEKIM
jgi:hypothetical protein